MPTNDYTTKLSNNTGMCHGAVAGGEDEHGTFVEMDGERHYIDDNPDWNELVRPPHPLPWTPERADHDIIWNNEPDIDWEQRRYEIAREMYVHFPSMSVEAAVNHANMLIEELKKFAKE